MALEDRIKEAIKQVEDVKSGTLPEHIKTLLISYKDVKDSLTLKRVDGVLEFLSQHAVALSLDSFKFSSLPIQWGGNKKNGIGIDFIYTVMSQRVAANDALARDGVALSMSYDEPGNKFFMLMEDMKGRTHPLAWGEPRHGMQKFKLVDGKKKTTQMNGLDMRKPIKISSALPPEFADRIKKIFEKTILVKPRIDGFKEHNSLWFCDKDGVSIAPDGVSDKIIPVPFNYPSATTNAQISKLDKTIIPYLSNAARIGPTMKTLTREFSSAFEESKELPGEKFTKAIQEKMSQIKGVSKKFSLPASALVVSTNKSESDNFRVRVVLDAFLRAGAMLNVNASQKRQHSGVVLKNRKEKPKPTSVEDMKVSIPDDAPLKSVFLENYKNTTSVQLAKKLLEAAHPDGILPLTAQDIQNLEKITSTMQTVPDTAQHGLVWFSAIVKEKQMELIQIAPKFEREEELAPEEPSVLKPKR